MKSRTSFFNPVALRKDILRYSPIWALYTIFLLLIIFSEADFTRPTIARDVVGSMSAMAWINFFYGGICGAFLFMDLFNSRLCNALHAFPMRREGWLITHILSGFLFSFVPNLLATAIVGLMLWEYAYIALLWLAVATLQYLFFFGTIVLAVTCAGNLLGTVAIYGIIHFITVLVYGVAELFYQPLLYGVKFYDRVFYRFFPLDQLDGFDYVNVEINHAISTFPSASSLGYDYPPYLRYKGLEGEAWVYVGLCAAVGVVCLFLACLAYRRRNLENAGDFISLRPLAPLFVLVCTIAAGTFLYLFAEALDEESYLFLFLGMVIGYFAGKMLLNRTLKVFGKKSILAFAGLTAALAFSFFLTWLDPMGISTYVPNTKNVEAAYLWGGDKGYYYLTDHAFYGSVDIEETGFQIVDEEELEDLRDFHSQLIEYRYDENDGSRCEVRVHYILKSGRSITRYYEVGRDSSLGQRAGKYFSDMRYIFEVNDTEILYDAFDSVSVDFYKDYQNLGFEITDPQEIAGLLDAIAKDCENGNMVQIWAYHQTDSEYGKNGCNIALSVKSSVFEQGGFDRSRFYLDIYSDCSNIHAYLDQLRAHSEKTE